MTTIFIIYITIISTILLLLLLFLFSLIKAFITIKKQPKMKKNNTYEEYLINVGDVLNLKEMNHQIKIVNINDDDVKVININDDNQKVYTLKKSILYTYYHKKTL